MLNSVIVVDDEAPIRQAVEQWLTLSGFEVQVFARAEECLAQLPEHFPGVMLTDVRMPGMSGLELLSRLQGMDPDLPVILLTGHGDVPMAVEAMREGAYDFLEKPFASDAMLDSVRRALALRRLVLDNRSLRLALSDRQQLSTRLIGQSPSILRLREQIGALAGTRADVLILGETGAGKEVVARALHDLSNRRSGPFVAINAGALAESVVESELFGHEPGAFTGAQKRRIGKFEFANGGTLFLDEIESMSLDVQVKLLRLLQERVVERMGSNQQIPLDIRIIAATKEDLRQAADQGRFRADLYYRLNVASLRIPPLRERGEDALMLFEHYADAASMRHGIPKHELKPGQRALLLRHNWPGNVRELQNAAERFALGLELELEGGDAEQAPPPGGGLSDQVESFERALIAAELARPHSSVRSLAEALGVPRKTLHDKLRKHGLTFGDSSGASDDND
ncbi:C4 dicarboxylate transport two-component response regulator [Pseudomonas amygdali pv. eriobotryae]|uniref:HTH-type transcriptional regulatory protein TyrR n=1 Tax=Pseudomonas amygdali pv. eriobotryae TaxID=129137 RepID=A0A3M3AKK0_PSEA0|nr:sigma-54 dependent transcriptional regulator [Pseudomonas amygdali]RMM01013.1 C4 dicarboxylate transport two-component response regulator [Pseudomonas amygdali pv. eriobotryae]